jgi:hypothetical protein
MVDLIGTALVVGGLVGALVCILALRRNSATRLAVHQMKRLEGQIEERAQKYSSVP